MGDTLVVYFSRSGVTQKLAADLARRLGADLVLVRPLGSYRGTGGYLRGVWQALQGHAPPVEPLRDATRYSLVVIGTPVWVGRLSPPMRSYLRSLRRRLRSVAAFWVSGSGAPYKAVAAEVEQLTGQAPVATVSFSQHEVKRGAAAKLEAFADALRTPKLRAA